MIGMLSLNEGQSHTQVIHMSHCELHILCPRVIMRKLNMQKLKYEI